MEESPLAPPPADSAALRAFLAHFGLEPAAPPGELLRGIITSFARLPYENLTKIIKQAETGRPDQARRWPKEVVADHVSLGAGGTCFSLTSTLLHLVRAIGFRAEPVLADRHYGPDTHCAMLVWIDGLPHLVDPGFLILQPVPLAASGEQRLETAFNEVILRPREGGERIELLTRQDGKETPRLTFKAGPADPGAFLRAWDASFGWDMMRYPLLTSVRRQAQVYLHETRLLRRTRGGSERTQVDLDDLPRRIAEEFGLDPAVVARAVAILKRKGELHGRDAAR